VVWDAQSRNWILRFEGARIPTNELRFFIGDDDTPESRRLALDTLVENLTLLHRADMHGVGLDEDERAMWASWVVMQMGELFVPPERVGEFAAASFGEVWERLMDIYVPDMLVYIDEYTLANDFVEYLGENRARYMDMEVKFILLEEEETAVSARDRLLAGELDFDELIRLYDPWYTPDEEIMVLQMGDLISMAGLTPEQGAELIALQPGEVSEIIAWGEDEFASYLMVYVETREEPDEEEAATEYRRRYILSRRHEMMLGLVPQWVAQAEYTVNQRALDRV
jgi:hypothetical protein